jgi:lactoylglutathione lyase
MKRILHTMLRVSNLENSLNFYTDVLGMKLHRREEYPQGRFTLAFIGYQDENTSSVIELTHNWDVSRYEKGNAYGHIALSVPDIYAACAALEAAGAKIIRKPGPMTHSPAGGDEPDAIAFIEDPDGYRIELIQARL